MPFNTNVFINCPFNKDYKPLLRTLTFTLLYLDLEPKLSQTLSSSTIRINQIKQYIRSCKLWQNIKEEGSLRGNGRGSQASPLNLPDPIGDPKDPFTKERT